jgi:SAM-dependent methyltransferase
MSWKTSQNFLGAWWAPLLVERAPAKYRERIALRMLSFSPHYIFDTDRRFWMPKAVVEKEARRNMICRGQIVRDVIRPHISASNVVVDYGCGPGYMAVEAARFAKRVIACDVSEGVLACARVLNGASNIQYVNVSWTSQNRGVADLAYSFAVALHLRDSVLSEMLRAIHRVMRPGGRLLLHAVVNAVGLKTEAEWVGDRSFRGRLNLRYALNCFSRSPEQVVSLAEGAGFSHCQLLPLANLTSVDDYAAKQHLLTCLA